MLENPFVLAVGSIMVLLMVLAWWFPNQKWLDPFRSMHPPRRPARPLPTASDPEAEPGRPFAVTFAAIFFIVGAGLTFTRGRE